MYVPTLIKVSPSDDRIEPLFFPANKIYYIQFPTYPQVQDTIHKLIIMRSSFLIAAATTSCAHAFVQTSSPSRTLMPLNMGVFDGVKEAFGADGMGELSVERETPIDRWMGWNTKSVDSPQVAVGSKSTCNSITSPILLIYLFQLLTFPFPVRSFLMSNSTAQFRRFHGH